MNALGGLRGLWIRRFSEWLYFGSRLQETESQPDGTVAR